ncbi:MAG: DUF6056 family protein [Prevotella sp.]|nr:DUF6056 family protein [Bacteroides sp.]MCM1365623.1 DUF6056 family protein [Prevotella sp.]
MGKREWIFFAIAVLSFCLLDIQSIWLGDDYGYYFTDSSIHKGDGTLITNPAQIFSTQMQHWMNCNGRFIIHSIVSFFVSIAGHTAYVICNSLMFGICFILFYKLVLPGRKMEVLPGLFMLILLWLIIPRPGITMLSLASYSINYLWTGVAILSLIKFFENLSYKNKYPRSCQFWCPVAALLIGALQESYSLPLSAAFLVMLCINYKKYSTIQFATIICFWVGTAIVSFAPGNVSHAEMGGGLSVTSLVAKNTALAKDVMFSPINLLAIILIVISLTAKERFSGFFKNNLLLLTAILMSLLLATVSYTAIRQLFAPSLFAAILIGKILFSIPLPEFNLSIKRLIEIGLGICYTGLIAGAFIIREYPVKVMDSVIFQVQSGKSIITIPNNNNEESELFNFLFNRYNDDPTTGQDIKLLFDHYTKQGLGRIYSPHHSKTAVNTFLPIQSDSIYSLLSKSDTTYSDGEITTKQITKYYRGAIIPAKDNGKPIYKVSTRDGKFTYERFYRNGNLYYIFPNYITTLTILK